MLSGDSSKLIQPSGGYYEYYDPKLIERHPQNYYSIIYKRYSYDCYSGIVMANLNQHGELLSELFIAGDSLEFGQKEFYYQGEDSFSVVERVIFQDQPIGHEKFKGYKLTKKYRIGRNGKIMEKESLVEEEICLSFPKDEEDYRLKECAG